MNTHDLLAYAISAETVRRVRAASAPWNTIFSVDTYVTSSRTWPLPDFVLRDVRNDLTVGVEFKPPRQTKREYLTGLGQAISYTKDFVYSLLVQPTIADDGYHIADHVRRILEQPAFAKTPVGLLKYEPSSLAPGRASFDELRFFDVRGEHPSSRVSLNSSFYAKWREASPEELFRFISNSYEETRSPTVVTGTVRDRAFDALWCSIQAGELRHWSGGVRQYANTTRNKIAVSKNYRNFPRHLGWTESDGRLPEEGLRALHVGTLYGPNSRLFSDALAKASLIQGKHLVLFNTISEFQDSRGSITDERHWFAELESFLDEKGLLQRNIGRSSAATAGSARQFLKAEKQFWRNLDLIIPRGARIFHPGRGFIFNWARIADLLQSNY